jgi:hypothetical protein|tara:strand:+ start:1037 stop:2080 length:1044 start_codon:yes stop_codon:yes gene_type:complete
MAGRKRTDADRANKTYTRTVPTEEPTTIFRKKAATDPATIEASKQRCLAQGGTWNEETKTCTLPREPVGAGGTIENTPEANRAVGRLSETQTEQLGQQAGVLQSGAARLKEREIQSQQQAVIEQERERLTREEVPERTELGAEAGFAENIPLIGGAVAFGRKNIGGPIKDLLGIERLQPELELTPDELRTEALTQIEKEEIERGLSASETFGAFVESLQLGSLSNFIAEKPSENAREVISNVRKERRRISNIETNVKMGYLPVEAAQDQIIDIENNVQRLESRLKLLLHNSPEYHFDSDGVNTFETELLLTKEKIFQGKQNILTGASQDPTELQILQQLQLQGDEEE